MNNWKQEFKSVLPRMQIEWIETEVIEKIIQDARYTFRNSADSFEEGEQQLRSKWLGKG